MSNIYSIVSIDKQFPEYQYINAVSYSKEILQNMIKHIHPDDFNLADFYIKENTDVYFFTKIKGETLLSKPLLHDDIIVENLYGFNMITNSNVSNILLDITGYDVNELREIYKYKDWSLISSNIIKFDVFYEEGIVND